MADELVKVCEGRKTDSNYIYCGWREDRYCTCSFQPGVCPLTKEEYDALPTKPLDDIFNELAKRG